MKNVVQTVNRYFRRNIAFVRANKSNLIDETREREISFRIEKTMSSDIMEIRGTL